MEGLTVTAILKIVAEYGVLGLGWVAWILTMWYLRAERKQYQALVIHIIGYFTQANTHGSTSIADQLDANHKTTFSKLFGGK